MKSIQAGVDARGSDATITPEELTKFQDLRSKVEALDNSIATAEYVSKVDAEVALRADPVQSEERAKSFGEFIQRFIRDPNSPRVDSRDMTQSNPLQSGLAVPPEYENMIRALDPSEAIVRPRATVIAGSGASPDATFKITAFNQGTGGNQSVYGGVTMSFVAENATRPNAGDIKLQEISLEPQPLVGYMDISKQLLENSSAIGIFAEKQLKLAGISVEERSFIGGSGIGAPTGLLNHPCAAVAARTTVGQITYDDILNMVSKSYGNSNGYVWIASRTAQPTLSKLKDTAGNLIWSFNGAITGAPPTLYGIPVFFSERLPAVGTSGDLILADLSKYIIRDGSSPRLFLDPYTRAINNFTRLYVSWNVDAKPWLTAPITCEDGVARSPFVNLS
jgi:HK97 family phage major capsid protein